MFGKHFMHLLLSSYLTSLTTLLCLDALWIGLIMRPFYSKHLGHLFADTISVLPAAAFYLMYPLGLTFFVIAPHVKGPLTTTIVLGALLGFIAYGTYDFTNQATLKDWPLIVTIVDLAWGTIVTALTAGITKLILNWVQS